MIIIMVIKLIMMLMIRNCSRTRVSAARAPFPTTEPPTAHHQVLFFSDAGCSIVAAESEEWRAKLAGLCPSQPMNASQLDAGFPNAAWCRMEYAARRSSQAEARTVARPSQLHSLHLAAHAPTVSAALPSFHRANAPQHGVVAGPAAPPRRFHARGAARVWPPPVPQLCSDARLRR